MQEEHKIVTEKILAIDEALEQVYHGSVTGSHLLNPVKNDPVDCLMMTVLSQATNDRNSHKAFANLKARFPLWETMLEASLEEIAGKIKVGGLCQRKAVTLKDILQRIQSHNGRISLDFLKMWEPARAYQYLLSLPGVGHKTASCVLLFALGKPAFPVDTHVLRVSRRLGLVSDRAGADEAHRILVGLVPPQICGRLHLNLIQHGRTTCRAKSPRCESCIIRQYCNTPVGFERHAAERMA